MWPNPWSLENTMSPTENSIRERDSLLMSPRYPSPSLYETSVAAAPLCSCQQAGVCMCLGVCVCVHALVEVGLAVRLVRGVLWHLPLWRGLACTLVGHYIYQWLIVASRSPWKHNRDLWPRRAQRQRSGHISTRVTEKKQTNKTFFFFGHI